jgi:hypothetical protein
MDNDSFFLFLIFMALLVGLIVGYKKGISKRSVSKYKPLWIVTFALSLLGTLISLGSIFFVLFLKMLMGGGF